MFSSADGYCSAVVFSNNELGVKYEKPINQVQECDVEMMDIPVNKPQKRRVSLTPAPTTSTTTTTTTTATDKSKKRRITPILISTPMQPPPPS